MDAFERLVIVNRYNAPEPLEISFPLDLAIDKPWCEQTSRAIAGRTKWEICEATETLAEQLPDRPGLYVFVWRIPFAFPSAKLANHYFRVAIYIGQAGGKDTGNTLKSRYQQEYSSLVSRHPQALWDTQANDRISRLRRYLNLRDLEFWYHEVIQSDLLLAFEESLIKLFNPPGNSQFTGRSPSSVRAKLGRAIPAF
jgi:hypothetical protein